MLINKRERKGSALVVIDVQVDVVKDAFERDSKIANMAVAVEKARAIGLPIIWVQDHESLPIGSDGWQIVPELIPLDTEARIGKFYRSSFEGTNLEDVLSNLSIGHLYICGAETNNCVSHTCHAALERGFDLTLIADAHTTTGFEWNGFIVDAARVIDEQNTNFFANQLPGRSIRSVQVAELFN
jgi:nicotinamidase-related amidase